MCEYDNNPELHHFPNPSRYSAVASQPIENQILDYTEFGLEIPWGKGFVRIKPGQRLIVSLFAADGGHKIGVVIEDIPTAES